MTSSHWQWQWYTVLRQSIGCLKAEVKGHFQDVKKHFDNMSWDWCQVLRHSYPCGSIFNACEHAAVKIEESHELSRKSIENQALMVSELQKMNQFFQSRKQQQPPQQLLEPPLLEKVGPNSAVLAAHSWTWDWNRRSRRVVV